MEKPPRVVEDGTIQIPPEEILPPRQAIERAQALVREYVPEGRSLVDELITERRAKAERE